MSLAIRVADLDTVITSLRYDGLRRHRLIELGSFRQLVATGRVPMCFGPVASFASSAGLAAIGIATIRRRSHPRQIPIALIPLLFSVQQLLEGVLWIVLVESSRSSLSNMLMNGFLFVAFIVWPVATPLCVYLLEPKRSRKLLMRPFIALGVVVSSYLLWFLATETVTARIVNHCILYDAKIYGPRELVAIYLTATVVPFLFSSSRIIVLLGVVNIALCAVAFYAYAVTFVSVWCFLAAIVSAFIYYEVSRGRPRSRAMGE